MARRPWAEFSERDQVPYVTRSETHRALTVAVESRPDQPVLVCGEKAGCGVTRTLEEFSALLEGFQFRHNVLCRHVTIDFFTMSYRPLPLILTSLRNQLIERSNENKIQNAHIHFKDFDMTLKGWCVLYYLPGFKKPGLTPSERQKRVRQARSLVAKLSVGAMTGTLLSFDDLNALLSQFTQEGAEAVTEAAADRMGQKYAKWLETRISQRSRRAVRSMRKPKNAGLGVKDFEAALLVFFTEAVIELQQSASDKLRFVFNFDSLDEYEADRDHEADIRGSICSVVQEMTPTPSSVALGTRGTPQNWMEEMNTINFVSSELGLLTRTKVEEAWRGHSAKERVNAAIAEAFSNGREEVRAAELADAWSRCV